MRYRRKGWGETALVRSLASLRLGSLSWGRHGALFCLLVVNRSSASSTGPSSDCLSAGYKQEESSLTPVLRMDGQAEQLSFLCKLSPSGMQILPSSFSTGPGGDPQERQLASGQPAAEDIQPAGQASQLPVFTHSAPCCVTRFWQPGEEHLLFWAVLHIGGAQALSGSQDPESQSPCPCTLLTDTIVPPSFLTPHQSTRSPVSELTAHRSGSLLWHRRCWRQHVFQPQHTAQRCQGLWPKGSGWGSLAPEETGRGLQVNFTSHRSPLVLCPQHGQGSASWPFEVPRALTHVCVHAHVCTQSRRAGVGLNWGSVLSCLLG